MLDDLSVVVKVVPRSRSLRVRIMPDSSVLVTAPNFTPQSAIDRFLNQHEDWIREKRSEVLNKLTALVADREHLFFQGRQYNFRLKISNQAKPSVQIDGETIVVTSPAENHDDVRKVLEKFYRIKAIKLFKQRVPLLADLVDSTVKTVSIRSQRTRWGSCSSRNTISLNWRLIMAPDWVSDYVIYHELAHLTHMNHSRQFWLLVEQYVPNHHEAQKWLKDHHSLLQF